MKQNAKEHGMDMVQNPRPEDGPDEGKVQDGILPDRPRRLLGTELASESALAEDWLSERDEEAWKHL